MLFLPTKVKKHHIVAIKMAFFFTNVALKIAYFGALTSENVVPAINHCMKHVS